MRLNLIWVFIYAIGCGPQLASSGKDSKVAIAQRSPVTEAGAAAEVKGTGSVVVPPGAVAVGSTLAIEEVATPEAFGAGKLVQPGAPALLVGAYASDGSELSQAAAPMTVNLLLPESQSASLVLLPASSNENLCVLLAAKDSSLIVWRRSGVSFDPAARSVSIQSPHFGIYQLVYCGKDRLPGFKEAALLGLSTEPKLQVTLQIPAGFRTATNHGKYCAFMTQLGTERDEVISVAEAAVVASEPSSLSMTIVSSMVDEAANYVLVVALMPAASSCWLNVGDDGRTQSGNDAALELYAHTLGGASLRNSGFTGTLGEGILALAETQLEIGAGDDRKVASPREHAIACVESKSQQGTVQIRTSIDGEGKLSGSKVMTIPVLAGDGADSTLTAFMGIGCGRTTVDTANPRTGLPYVIRWPQQAVTEPFIMVPLVLQLANASPLIFQGDACVKISPASKPFDLGQRLLSLTVLEYGIYLPYLPDSAYDLTLHLVTSPACSAVNTAVPGLSVQVVPNDGTVVMEIKRI